MTWRAPPWRGRRDGAVARAGPAWGRRRREVLAARACTVLAVALGGSLLTSCTPSSNAIGAPESPPCLRAIPASRRAVHSEGTFAGVRYLSIKDLRGDLWASHELGAKPSRRGKAPPALAGVRSAVCVVAWEGHFGPAAVLAGWAPPGNRRGRLAIVVVRQHDARVLVTIVLERPPLGLSRVFPHLLQTPVLR